MKTKPSCSMKLDFEGGKLYDDWLNDKLAFNIVDAPNNHLHLLPEILKQNKNNLSKDGQEYAICYALTKKNNLTKYHEDVLGDGWVYLETGCKVWHLF